MPHLTLEYSDNLPGPVDFDSLFARLHAALVETASVRLADIKSRAVAQPRFRVGAGGPEAVFAHLTVALFGGRDVALQRQITERLLEILRDGLARAWAERPCDLTVEIREIRRETYAKAMNDRARGTAAPTA